MTTPVVVFVSLPESVGGSSRSLLTLLAELDGRCHRVLAAPSRSWLVSRAREHGLADEVVDIGGLGRSRLLRPLDAVGVLRVALAHKSRLAAIHANGLAELNLVAVAARLTGARTVVWCHDHQVTRWASRLVPPLARLSRARLLPVSTASRSLLVGAGIDGLGPVVTNPIGHDAVRLSDHPTISGAAEGARPFTVGYLGSPESYKGFDLLPSILDNLDTRGLERLLVFSDPEIGDSHVWDLLRSDDRVEIRGTTDDVTLAYRSCDVVLCPSRQESFGRVAAEAMANGVPVVAADLPALREVLGDAGTYFRAGDPVGAARKISELSGSADLRDDLARRGLARIEAHDPSAVADRLAAEYGIP